MYLQSFKHHLKKNELREAEALICEDYLYDQFKISCDEKCFSMIDTIIQKYNFDINQENYFPITYYYGIPVNINFGETLIYYLCRSDNNFEVISYLVQNYDLHLNTENTIYHPLQSCILNGLQKKIFNFLISHPDTKLDIFFLNDLITQNDLDSIKKFCFKFINKFGNNILINFINQQNSIHWAFINGQFSIAKYLIYLTRYLPFNTIITKYGKFSIKHKNPRCTIIRNSNDIILKSIKPSFTEFYQILEFITNTNSVYYNISDLRNVYSLFDSANYNHIYKAANFIYKYDYSFSVETIKYLLDNFKKYNTATFIQKRISYLFQKKNKNESIKLIQKKWRRKYYLQKLFNECSICGDYLIERECQKLYECSHIFHKNCISTWRKTFITSNAAYCPICRGNIIRSPVNL